MSFTLPFVGASKPSANEGSVFVISSLGTNGVAIAAQSGAGKKAIGVFGHSPEASGIGGLGGHAGVKGVSVTTGGSGVIGEYRQADATPGGFSDALNRNSADPGFSRGFLGTATAGVQGETDIVGGKGVAGKANASGNSVGVYGESAIGFAAFFRGKVTITDHLITRTLYAQQISAEKGLIGGAAGKFFKIDHPLDPANKFLYHASIESHEYKNLYDGVVTLDDSGSASVTLPQWFEALNTDFRYQLTTIGGYAPVYIAKEVKDGRFAIAGGRAGMKISWQVTGVRNDAYAKQHPVKVEETKAPNERGRYVSPVELGYPDSLAIHSSNTTTVGSPEGNARGSRTEPPRSKPTSAVRPPR